jgi:hypothetical protein
LAASAHRRYNGDTPVWRNGRRNRLKIDRPQGHVGSTPSTGTNSRYPAPTLDELDAKFIVLELIADLERCPSRSSTHFSRHQSDSRFAGRNAARGRSIPRREDPNHTRAEQKKTLLVGAGD